MKQIIKGDLRSYKMTFPLAAIKDGKTIDYSFDSVAIALQEAIVQSAQKEGVVFTGLLTQALQVAQMSDQVALIRAAVFEGSLILTPASEKVDTALKMAISQLAADVAATFDWGEVSISYHNEKWQLVVGQNFHQQ